MIFTKQATDVNELNRGITNLQTETQTKFSELSTSVLEIETGLKSLGSQVGSLDNEMTELKASASSDFSGVIEDAIKSVVTIRTDISQGSGFVIADGGYIVTNAHVIQGATAAQIITYDEKTHNKVWVIGKNENMDIALLKIESSIYDSLTLGNSENVQIGEKVITIGNPLGLQFSVSEGIISAVHREGDNGLKAYIQTDAALNSGNSGGPLINTAGKVIGINNFKIDGGENLGFSLESDYIKSTVNEIFQEVYSRDLI
jgi:S1-C subfamily serine protease